MKRRIEVMENFLRKQADDGTQRTNCFCSKEALYSYGYHYEIARWTGVEDENGREVMLTNTYQYSVTTAKHLREFADCLRAVRSYARIIPHESGDPLSQELANAAAALTVARASLESEVEPIGGFTQRLYLIKEELPLLEKIQGHLNYGYHKRMKETLSWEEIQAKGAKTGLREFLWRMVRDGVEVFADRILEADPSWILAYKFMGGVVDIPKVPKGKRWAALWEYAWLRDHMTAEDAIRVLGSPYPAIRNLASHRLEKGD